MEPQEYKFSYTLMSDEGSSSIRLANGTKQPVMFEITTSNLYEYSVLPCTSVIPPESSYDVRVALVGPKSLPTNVKFPHKFFVKSKVRIPSDDKAGFPVQEFKSGVIYISPGQIRTKPVVEKPTSSSSASEITSSNIPEMAAKKLLDIQPSELKFNFELKKDVTCLLQLTNTSDNTVVFKVITNDRNKYRVRPNIGIILPKSSSNIIVTMIAQEEIPSDKQGKDKFLIQSIVVPPSTTTQDVTPKMFDDKERRGEDFELGVVYIFPSPIPDVQSSTSDTSKAPSSLEESEVPSSLEEAEVVLQREEVPLNNNAYVKQEVKTNWTREFGDCLIKGLMGIIFWYLLNKLMTVIWSASVVMITLVGMMIKHLVSNSVEDWFVKGLTGVFVHFVSRLFWRNADEGVPRA
ncbi:hypothetical protein ABFS82_14G043600 [Erythranthe guttata]